MTTEHTCNKRIWRGLSSYSCGKKAKYEHKGEWYCKTHHPPTVRAKTDARNEMWRKQWAEDRERSEQQEAQRVEQNRRATLYPDLIQAMHDIARQPEGDEQSAQAVAREMLKMCGEDAP
jgi:hypothetical protein